MKTILVVLGTRPEAIKLAPVVLRLRSLAGVRPVVCVTGQHRQLLDPVLTCFDITPQVDLRVMEPGQGLARLTARVLAKTADVVAREHPDWVVVQGDTVSALAGAMAGFYGRVPVAHVEAGLRTGDRFAPWPEEVNRRLVSPLADLHLTPTATARDHLLREGIPAADIEVTGNTVIDALLLARERLGEDPQLEAARRERFAFLNPKKHLLLVTGHRRENFGRGLRGLCAALTQLARRPDLQIVYPVHPNPEVRAAVNTALRNTDNVHLIPPQTYLDFVHLLDRAYLVLTDSGGIQEEAPALGKPVLVTRRTTERPEAVAAGTARLVGTDTTRIIDAVTELIDDAAAYRAMSRAHNPYGDGRAAERVCARLLRDRAQGA